MLRVSFTRQVLKIQRPLVLWAQRTQRRWRSFNYRAKNKQPGVMYTSIMWYVHTIKIMKHSRSRLLSNAGPLCPVRISTIPSECLFYQEWAFNYPTRRIPSLQDRMFLKAWIRRFGPTARPANSPTRTSLDVILGGYVKDHQVYRTSVLSALQFKWRISTTSRTVSCKDFHKVWLNLENRWQDDITKWDAHVEYQQ